MEGRIIARMNRLIVGTIALLFAARLDAGLTYRMETTTSGVRLRVFNGIVKTEGGQSRFDVVRSDEKMFEAGSIILTSTDDSVMTVLNPARKSYYVIDMVKLAVSVAETRKQLAPWMSMSRAVATVKNEGPGGMIQGYPTQRWVVDTTMAMKTPARMTITSRLEIWATEKLPGNASSMVPGSVTATDPIFGSLRESVGKIRGLPLRSVTVTTMTTGGSTTTTTSRMNVTAIHVSTIAPSEFVIPSGYRKVDSPIEAMLGAFGGH